MEFPQPLIKKIALNLLVAAIALLIGLITIELLLRIFYPQNLNITQIDGERIFSHKPGIETLLQRQEFKTHVSISSQGLRDREYSIQKPANTTRIAVIGDSFVFGFGVEADQAFPKVLEAQLKAREDRNYEIMNFGISAYGTEQEYLLLQDILKFSPDTVILSFSPNDFKENIKYSLFDFTNGTLTKNPSKEVPFSLKIRNFISWHSHLYSLLYFSVIDNSKATSFLIKAHLLNPPNVDPATDFDTLIFKNEENANFDYALWKTRALLIEINRFLQTENIQLIVVIVPFREQVDSAMMETFAQQHGIGEWEVNSTKAHDLILDMLKAEHIPVIDPLQEFRLRNTNNTFYYSIDAHWNAEGHKLMASVLSKELQKKYVIWNAQKA